MKNRIIIILVALIATLSLSAQTIKIYKNSETTPVAIYGNSNGISYKVRAKEGNTLEVYKNSEYTATATYMNTADTKYRAVMDNKASDPNLLIGVFSVGANKKVQFTKSNLYWDGSAFKFEANQTDYPTSWSGSHVSHFYWTKNVTASYAQSYSDGTNTTDDVPFFAESTGGLTVEGTSGLFALSKEEWQYLISSRTNATNLRKNGVSVSNNGTTYTDCLLIAPDGFDTSKWHNNNSYTLNEVNSLGLVCLPPAGYREGSQFRWIGNSGMYWSSTPNTAKSGEADCFYFNYVSTSSIERYYGHILRLVALS